ncbi:hypothetical protein N431DRAFT_484214 [Stipitochalara longipes BDJ]|nr:hypothetical protein N431DRAFT_484214 [Stipitochalara longipes BDJ]
MANIRTEAFAAKQKVASASFAISNLQRGVQEDIGNGMHKLHSTLTSSVQSIEGILDQQKSRRLSLALFQTSSSKARALQRSVDDMLQNLDNAIQIADETHSHSQSYYLKALDLPNSHLRPARDSVKSLRGSISIARRKLDLDLESAATLQRRAHQRAESARLDIAKKQENINSIEQKEVISRNEVARLGRERINAEEERASKVQRAQRLRREAEDRRTRGKIVAFCTLGLGVPYLLHQFNEADNCEGDARSAERRSDNLASQLLTIQSTSSDLQRQSNNLRQEISTLQLSKQRLDEDRMAQILRVQQLESQIRNINREVQDAQGLLLDAGYLDSSIDSLSTRVGTLKQQLLDLKQKLDGLKAALEESKDRSLFKVKRGKALGISKEGRAQMMLLLAETGQERNSKSLHLGYALQNATFKDVLCAWLDTFPELDDLLSGVV